MPNSSSLWFYMIHVENGCYQSWYLLSGNWIIFEHFVISNKCVNYVIPWVITVWWLMHLLIVITFDDDTYMYMYMYVHVHVHLYLLQLFISKHVIGVFFVSELTCFAHLGNIITYSYLHMTLYGHWKCKIFYQYKHLWRLLAYFVWGCFICCLIFSKYLTYTNNSGNKGCI